MTPETQPKLVQILLVEDNPGDVRLIIEAFREGKLCNNLRVVENGEEAMAYLRRESRYIAAPRPDLILLDLNMPKMNGHEVLAEIKEDPEFKSIPVVVLTTSDAENDILKTYDLHANCYVTKPVDFEQFIRIVKFVKDFWLSIVKLPHGG
jgi:CheY-like chemotaxis protein